MTYIAIALIAVLVVAWQLPAPIRQPFFAMAAWAALAALVLEGA